MEDVGWQIRFYSADTIDKRVASSYNPSCKAVENLLGEELKSINRGIGDLPTIPVAQSNSTLQAESQRPVQLPSADVKAEYVAFVEGKMLMDHLLSRGNHCLN